MTLSSLVLNDVEHTLMMKNTQVQITIEEQIKYEINRCLVVD